MWMKKGLHSTDKDLSRLEYGEDNQSLAQQNQEQLADYKSKLVVPYNQLAGLAIREDDEFLTTHGVRRTTNSVCSLAEEIP